MRDQIEQYIRDHMDQLCQDTVTLTRIKSVSQFQEGAPHPFGEGCAQVLDRALELAAQKGFQVENHEYYCGSVLLPGETKDEIGIMVHLDVVPEGDPAFWSYPPYEAHIEDGYIHGRGSCDNKSCAMVALYLLQGIRELGISLKHTIRLIFGCNEEAGMRDILYFLSKHEPPVFSFTIDGYFALSYAEKGLLAGNLTTVLDEGGNLLQIHSGHASNVIPNYAWAVLSGVSREELSQKLGEEFILTRLEEGQVKVEVHGIGGHTAFGEKTDSAILKLCRGLLAAGVLTPDAQKALQFVVDSTGDYFGTGFGIQGSEDESRTTVACGMLHTEGRVLTMNFNSRYIVSANPDALKSEIRSRAEVAGFSVKDWTHSAASYVDPDSNPIRCLVDCCNEILHTDYKPFVINGGTYARKMPNAVAYGLTMPDMVVPKGRGHAHEPNECVSISSLENGLRVYLHALPRLDNVLAEEGK